MQGGSTEVSAGDRHQDADFRQQRPAPPSAKLPTSSWRCRHCQNRRMAGTLTCQMAGLAGHMGNVREVSLGVE